MNFRLTLVIELPAMTDSNDSYDTVVIVDLVANPPVAHTNPPQPFFGFHFQATVGTWIVRQGKSRRQDSVLLGTIKPP